MTRDGERVTVLCVDDNPQVAEAMRLKIDAEPGFAWTGWLPNANELVTKTAAGRPTIVLLDIDMPGRGAFEALAEVSRACPASRVVIFSGYVQRDLIERAVQSGAWGYVSKNDGDDELFAVMHKVAAGELAFSPEVGAVYNTND